MNINPVPVDEKTAAQYAAYLARWLKPISKTQYLNIIHILHLECGQPSPAQDSWYVKTTKDIEKVKGSEVEDSYDTLCVVSSKSSKKLIQ